MADEMSRGLDELVRKARLSDDVDFLREGVRTLAQALLEAEVAQHLGAGRYERPAERTGERNGHRAPRTTVGHAGGEHAVARPPGARWGLFSNAVGAAAPGGAGAGAGEGCPRDR